MERATIFSTLLRENWSRKILKVSVNLVSRKLLSRYVWNLFDLSGLFVCGACSIKEGILCFNPKIKTFYQDKDRMSREDVDEYKYQGLVSRALQSIEDKEHLQFLGSSKPDFILFLRFKFGLCLKEAVTVFDRLQSDRAVNVDIHYNVLVDQEVIRHLIGW